MSGRPALRVVGDDERAAEPVAPGVAVAALQAAIDSGLETILEARTHFTASTPWRGDVDHLRLGVRRGLSTILSGLKAYDAEVGK